MRFVLLLGLAGLIAGCSASVPPIETSSLRKDSAIGKRQLPESGDVAPESYSGDLFTPPPGYSPKIKWDCWTSYSMEGSPHIRFGEPEAPLGGLPGMQSSSVQVDGKYQPGIYQKKGIYDSWLFCANPEKEWFDCAVMVGPSGTGHYKYSEFGEGLNLSCRRSTY